MSTSIPRRVWRSLVARPTTHLGRRSEWDASVWTLCGIKVPATGRPDFFAPSGRPPCATCLAIEKGSRR